jgi:hypothetical protein
MPKNPTLIGNHGPAIRALDPWVPSAGRMHQLLTDEERASLAVIASIVRFKKGETIYWEGDPAKWVFNIITGVVTSYRKAPDGNEHIVSFLLQDDLFGLSTEGRSPFERRHAGVSCHLQSMPGTAASAAARLFAQPAESHHQTRDVPSAYRTTANRPR